MESGSPNEDERKALERISASGTFHDCDALRRLLLYLGEATLSDRADQLKEYTVGVEALGRPAHYDPRTDSSARASAARLRRKIEDYYRTEGAGDTIRVGFPKGGFKLSFEVMDLPTVGADQAAARKWKRLAGVFAATTLAALILLALPRYGRSGNTPPAAAWSPELEAFWAPFLDDRTPILVSFGSPLFVGMPGCIVRWTDINDWQAATNSTRVKGLLSYLQGSHPDQNVIVPDYDYAGVGDVQGAFLVSRLLATRKPAQLSLKRGVVLSWEDIKSNHLVFIGNGKNQEKLKDLLTEGDFILAEPAILNPRPRAGEPREFREEFDARTGERRVDYAVITFGPGMEQGRYMLLLSAMSTETIWGAVEAVTSPKFAAPLVARLRSGGALPRAFQAVIRIRLHAGVPVEISYAAHHVSRSADGH